MFMSAVKTNRYIKISVINFHYVRTVDEMSVCIVQFILFICMYVRTYGCVSFGIKCGAVVAVY